MTRFAASIMLLLAFMVPQESSRFSELERAKIVEYWSAAGRYRIDAPATPGTNWPWVVRLTPEASLWFYNYNRARGFGKTAPNEVPGADSPQWAKWETWVSAKLAYDRWNASLAATAKAAASPLVGVPPPHPGPIPPDLLAAARNPPDFAAAVAPLTYHVTFDTGEKITYTDHPDVPARYAYYRFGQGVRSFGTPLRTIPDSELDAAFAEAGMSGTERKVARAVSLLEGGFESVNTYDTGFLSVGFLQFATLEPGSGSLGAVLLREKEWNPKEFESDFRRFGVDVNESGALVVVDPSTGAELAGNQAVRKIIDDKRLTAVFQRAGARSKAFRAAQIGVMKDRYYPAYDPVTVIAGERTLTGRVLDVVRSEAGLATLFDRKVNRGNIEPLASTVSAVMSKYSLASLAEAAAYEREIVSQMKYRHDFLADATLSQPPPVPSIAGESTSKVQLKTEPQAKLVTKPKSKTAPTMKTPVAADRTSPANREPSREEPQPPALAAESTEPAAEPPPPPSDSPTTTDVKAESKER